MLRKMAWTNRILIQLTLLQQNTMGNILSADFFLPYLYTCELESRMICFRATMWKSPLFQYTAIIYMLIYIYQCSYINKPINIYVHIHIYTHVNISIYIYVQVPVYIKADIIL